MVYPGEIFQTPPNVLKMAHIHIHEQMFNYEGFNVSSVRFTATQEAP